MLRHEVRQGIHAYVHEHPDARFEEIRRALGLSRGALSFHLRVLERAGFVAARTTWTRRSFRAAGAAPRAPPASAEETILALLRPEALGPSEVADRLGISRQLARYHLLALERRGVVTAEGAGRARKYRAPPRGP